MGMKEVCGAEVGHREEGYGAKVGHGGEERV